MGLTKRDFDLLDVHARGLPDKTLFKVVQKILKNQNNIMAGQALLIKHKKLIKWIKTRDFSCPSYTGRDE